MSHWMYDCSEVTRMVSESMDRRLPFFRRLGVRFHLMMCHLCSRYRRQLLLLRQLATRHIGADNDQFSECRLGEDARVRIKNKLNELKESE